jgi:hypothetical protein
VVEAHEQTTIDAFKSWGFKPVLVPFRNFLPFGTISPALLLSIPHTPLTSFVSPLPQVALSIAPLWISAEEENSNLTFNQSSTLS